MLKLYLSILIVLASACSKEKSKLDSQHTIVENDSLLIWKERASDNNYSQVQRETFVSKYLNKLEGIKNDSVRNSYYYKVPFIFHKLGDTTAFRLHIEKALKIADKQKDSASIADLCWDYANFHLHKKILNDSAFYYSSKAQKIFESIGDNDKSGRMLLIMATSQKNSKDFTSSEETTLRAIKIFKKINNPRRLSGCYNLLGIISKQLEEYDNSLSNYKTALDYLKKTDGNLGLEALLFNNMGNVFRDNRKYNKSIRIYKNGLELDSLKNKIPARYALLLDNLGYARLKLGDTTGVSNLFYEALRIRDSINQVQDIIVNKIHLSEYYIFKKDTLKAIAIATEAKNLAKETTNNYDLLAACSLLREIDVKNAILHYKDYVELSNKLQKQERANRNKFAKIKFDTENVITKNERLIQRQLWLIIVTVSVVVIAILLFVLRSQRAKNKELEFEQVQQFANEEIFNLMLQQQTKIDEGRQKEKERISEELHDGVLGQLFGTRLSLGSLNNKSTVEAKEMREYHIHELKNIEEEIRNISHELSLDTFNSEVGYITIVQNLLRDQSKISNFKYEIRNDSEIVWEEIESAIKINLFRIIQEAIQNINKYAEAKLVKLNFDKLLDHLELTIQDDGKGFKLNKTRKGIGIKNMRSRANKMRGKINIDSKTNQGTTIHVVVPF